MGPLALKKEPKHVTNEHLTLRRGLFPVYVAAWQDLRVANALTESSEVLLIAEGVPDVEQLGAKMLASMQNDSNES